MVYLQIEVTPEQFEQLRKTAFEEGFDTPEAYVKWLALEPTKEELLNDIREGLLATKRGDPMPTLDDLWTELARDGDETAS